MSDIRAVDVALTARNGGRAVSGAAEAARNPAQWTSDDDESLRVLKLGGTIGLVFLLLYTVYDLHGAREEQPQAGFYWLIVGGTLLFFGVTWTRWFRRLWKFWTLAFCVFLMAVFVQISAFTHDPESRFIAIMMIPLATASFVSWGPRWQAVMAAVCVLMYGAANYLVPISSEFNVYRWFGLSAALAFAQCTAIFIERFRLRLRGQLDALEEAARFRETQIATMAHDIRSPVAALSGYSQLLDDGGLSDSERTDLVARIGSTAWNMNLVVTNVLDLYRLQENGHSSVPAEPLDPVPVLEEIAEDCALQARRKGIALRTEFGELPRANCDARHFERIVRNLAAQAIALTTGGEIVLTAAPRNGHLAIGVSAPQAKVCAAELRRLLAVPGRDERPAGSRGLPLYLARRMAELAGGSVDVTYDPARGLAFGAEIPAAPATEDA
jgi:signal transduction histidine kinase